MDPKQFLDYVILPTLDRIELGGLNAALLLLGTALVESELKYLRQVGGGPALGVYQMEPVTHADIWANYLRRKPTLTGRIQPLLAPGTQPGAQLITNLAYATAMARVHYLRVPASLPQSADISGMAHYWKRYYNTYQPHQSEKYIQAQLDRFKNRLRATGLVPVDSRYPPA